MATYNVTLETLGDAATMADGERFAEILADEFAARGLHVTVFVEQRGQVEGASRDIDSEIVDQAVAAAWEQFGATYA